MNLPKRDSGPNALRRGRVSLPHANYFVTICLYPRRAVLLADTATTLLEEARLLATDHSWRLRCMTVMPDHVHLFFTLGERLTLSQTIARLKSKTQTLVRSEGTDWQENYYDHLVQPDDSIESIIRYIYLNPFQAELIQADQNWPYYQCGAEDWAWFQGLTDRGQPYPEWLQ